MLHSVFCQSSRVLKTICFCSSRLVLWAHSFFSLLTSSHHVWQTLGTANPKISRDFRCPMSDATWIDRPHVQVQAKIQYCSVAKTTFVTFKYRGRCSSVAITTLVTFKCKRRSSRVATTCNYNVCYVQVQAKIQLRSKDNVCYVQAQAKIQ